MPHYKNGIKAAIGDLVRGTGYNVKHEIIGVVVNVREGDSCNLSVAHIDTTCTILIPADWRDRFDDPFAPTVVSAAIEYGDTKSFEKIG